MAHTEVVVALTEVVALGPPTRRLTSRHHQATSRPMLGGIAATRIRRCLTTRITTRVPRGPLLYSTCTTSLTTFTLRVDTSRARTKKPTMMATVITFTIAPTVTMSILSTMMLGSLQSHKLQWLSHCA